MNRLPAVKPAVSGTACVRGSFCEGTKAPLKWKWPERWRKCDDRFAMVPAVRTRRAERVEGPDRRGRKPSLPDEIGRQVVTQVVQPPSFWKCGTSSRSVTLRSPRSVASLSRKATGQNDCPEVADWDDDRLWKVVAPSRETPRSRIHPPEPDYTTIRRELQTNKDVTFQLLWEEYREQSRTAIVTYCDLYRGWLRRQEVVSLHEHRAGEKLFVDYAGGHFAVPGGRGPQAGQLVGPRLTIGDLSCQRSEVSLAKLAVSGQALNRVCAANRPTTLDKATPPVSHDKGMPGNSPFRGNPARHGDASSQVQSM